jgi:hypothetical protein
MPRLSELLRHPVVDADGVAIGEVHDVRLVQDGPPLEGFGAALRLDGLVVGRGGRAVRLGYHRHQMRGPWLLKVVFASLERRARYVPWSVVERFDDGEIHLSARRADLPTVVDVY